VAGYRVHPPVHPSLAGGAQSAQGAAPPPVLDVGLVSWLVYQIPDAVGSAKNHRGRSDHRREPVEVASATCIASTAEAQLVRRIPP
jgi:hypothetical protein